MIKVLFITLIVLSTNCSDHTIVNEPIIKPINYSLKKLVLGIAFPPSADSVQCIFSIEHMNILNMKWYRIDVHWSDREPENDEFNWTPLSNRLAHFKTANKSVLITIDMKRLPQWWYDLETDYERVEEFKEFCVQLLSRFSADISMIQFGNEWNWEISKYLNNNDQLYIDMANTLYDAVAILPEGNRPAVVLGSLSIGALRFISYAAGSISKINFENGTIKLDFTENERQNHLNRINNIISNIQFDVADLHLYDDYKNWGTYLVDYKTLIGNCGKNLFDLKFIASEFGGPHPDFEPTDDIFASNQLLKYIQTLDGLDISIALYFKLVQTNTTDIAHPNSYLIDSELKPNSRYEVIRNLKTH